MKASRTYNLILSFALLAPILLGCTQNKAKRSTTLRLRDTTPTILRAVADVQFDGQAMVAKQMVQKNNALYLSGAPFGLAKWDILSDRENPYMTFAASDNLPAFVGSGKRWIESNFGSLAMAVVGNVAFTSGAVGLSTINLSNTDQPVVMGRYPFQDPKVTQDVRDPEGSFVYRALIPNPYDYHILYGFREQDYIYSLYVNYGQRDYVTAQGVNYDNGPKVIQTKKESYGTGGVCCVNGGTVFKNRAYIAFRSALWIFDFVKDTNPQTIPMTKGWKLSEPGVFNGLQAVNIQASDSFLYIHHVPTYASAAGSVNPAGIYVFDESGGQVAFLPLSPERFAVTPDDQYLYANTDNSAVRIFRMSWKR